eukprot:scaffold114097_cov18-Tisochrysis_lutea.AAC.3
MVVSDTIRHPGFLLCFEDALRALRVVDVTTLPGHPEFERRKKHSAYCLHSWWHPEQGWMLASLAGHPQQLTSGLQGLQERPPLKAHGF